MLTHPRQLPMGEHLFPQAGHLEHAASLALSLGIGSILQKPPTASSSFRQERQELYLDTKRTPHTGDALWDRVHLSTGVRRGTSHSGSFVPTVPGTPLGCGVPALASGDPGW